MSEATRGVVYMKWNDAEVGDKVEAALQRSLAALREVHPDLPYHVITIEGVKNRYKGLLQRGRLIDLTPFDETLFLDADTVPLEPLDYGFDMAARHGLALCINENPFVRRYLGAPVRHRDLVEYNTGVLFFTQAARPVFERWFQLAQTMDSRIFVMDRGEVAVQPAGNQGSFAIAVDELGFNPYVLPVNWNYRPVWHKTYSGPIKIWHDYRPVPEHVLEVNRRYATPWKEESVPATHFLDRDPV